MMTIKANGNEYKVEFSFDAAENKNIVQRIFAYISGAYLVAEAEKNPAQATMDGVSNMVADIPQTCIEAIYAGCLAHNPVTMDEAKDLARAYITEKRKTDKKYSYRGLFDEIKVCMEDDGFFELSGITAMIEDMNKSIEEAQNPKLTVVPQDHKKKQTSTR